MGIIIPIVKYFSEALKPPTSDEHHLWRRFCSSHPAPGDAGPTRTDRDLQGAVLPCSDTFTDFCNASVGLGTESIGGKSDCVSAGVAHGLTGLSTHNSFGRQALEQVHLNFLAGEVSIFLEILIYPLHPFTQSILALGGSISLKILEQPLPPPSTCRCLMSSTWINLL